MFFFLLTPRPPPSTLFPYTTLFRSRLDLHVHLVRGDLAHHLALADLVPGGLVPDEKRAFGHGHRHLRHDQRDFLGYQDRKSTRLNSSHVESSYAVFCLKKKRKQAQK